MIGQREADTMRSLRPRVRADLLRSRALHRGAATVVLIKDVRSGRAYELAPREDFVVRRLDGTRTLAQIGTEYAHRFGRRLGDAHWRRLLWLLHRRDLLQVPDREPPPASPATQDGTAGGAPLPWLDRWARAAGRIANKPTLVAAMLAIVAAQALVLWDLGPVWRAALAVRESLWLIPVVLLLTWASAVGHELAHALAARHVGCAVKRINLLLLRCEVEDYLYLPSRGAQVLIAAAGGLANGLFLVPVALAWLVVPADTHAATVVAAYLLVGSVQTWVNFLPLAPLDGYRICSHTLDMVDLAPESRRFLRTLPRQLIRASARYPAGAAVRLSGYGLCWLALVGGAGAGMVAAAGAALEPTLGVAGYYTAAAVVLLTLAGWLARPGRRPAPVGPPVATHAPDEKPSPDERRDDDR